MKDHEDEIQRMINNMHHQMPELDALLRQSIELPENAVKPPKPPVTWFDRLSHWLTYPSWQLPDLLSLRSFSQIFVAFPVVLGSVAAQILFFLLIGR
ncbi:MAG: hypothetical protein ACQETU_09285 [Bacillota bacterium]|uniref:hypothetical protein n=1 Tax=Bacillus velezensis TaxID=492670 RepID=UPI00086329C5|nr:hypothetical protein [Bacillus velezensis]AOU02888.1 hypothetical protein A2I97_18305 [Bacillus velezensis]NRR26435.1 hypothetical protein [Bacillus velezensis]